MSDRDYRETKFAEDYTGNSYRLDNLPVFDHPVDRIEPETKPELVEMTEYDRGYQDAVKRWLYVFNCALASIKEAENPVHQVYAIGFAVGSAMVCQGKSMDKIGDELGTTRAAISKSAVQFCKSMGIPPSPYMKSSIARNKYREARIESINNANIAARN